MRLCLRPAAALSLLLLLAPAQPLAAQPDEDEPAQTPTDLGELLGSDGLLGIERDYAQTCEFPGLGTSISRTKIIQQEDQVLFVRQSRLDSDTTQNYSSTTHVYTLQGEFVRREMLTDLITNQGRYSTTRTEVRDADRLIQRRQRSGTGTFSGATTDEQPEVAAYEPAEGAIPAEWIPLAVAYHLREGNGTFIVPVGSHVSHGAITYQYYLHVGDETIDVQGEAVVAHVLMLQSLGAEDDELLQRLGWDGASQKYVLPDGSVVRTNTEIDGQMVTTNAISREEAEEALNKANREQAEE